TYVPERTDRNGAAEIHITATDVGPRVVTIVVQDLTLPQRPTVEFVPGAGVRLAFVEVPTVGKAGRPLRPAVRVEIQDDLGNRVDSDAELTLRVDDAEFVAQAVRGVATFADVVIEQPGENTLRVSGPGMEEAVSDPISIIVGDPSTLRFNVEPTEPIVVGEPFSVQVQVLDPAGNLVVGSNETIRLRLYSNPTGTQLEGTLVKQAQEGVATFDDLVIRKASPGYQITAAAGGYQSAVSRVFTVASNEPVKDLSTLTV